MKKYSPLIAAVFLGAALAGPLPGSMPYNESADAKAELQHAVIDAERSHVPVLVIFGANWCEDCRALDRALGEGKNAELMARSFKVVKIDVGHFDRNLDLATTYGNPIKKGIPAVVLLADNHVVFATRAGELADARRMSETGIYDFFVRAANAAQATRKSPSQ